MSDIQSLIGVPHRLTVDGRTYECRHLDQERKGRFSAWLKRQAAQTIADYRRDTGDTDGWREMYREYQRACEAGGYCFYSERAVTALKTPAGVLALTAILFDLTEQETAVLVRKAPDETSRVVEAILAESVADPNA